MRLHLADLFSDPAFQSADFVPAARSLFLICLAGAFCVGKLGILDVEVLQVVYGDVHVVSGRFDPSLALLAYLIAVLQK